MGTVRGLATRALLEVITERDACAEALREVEKLFDARTRITSEERCVLKQVRAALERVESGR